MSKLILVVMLLAVPLFSLAEQNNMPYEAGALRGSVATALKAIEKNEGGAIQLPLENQASNERSFYSTYRESLEDARGASIEVTVLVEFENANPEGSYVRKWVASKATIMRNGSELSLVETGAKQMGRLVTIDGKLYKIILDYTSRFALLSVVITE